MKLLVVGRASTYETTRLIEAARARGHVSELALFDQLRFEADATGSRLWAGTRPLPGDYDALFVTGLNPFFSEILTVAESFAQANKVVVDSRLVTGNYLSSKMYEGITLAQGGIRVPRTVQPLSRIAACLALLDFSYPLILKGVHGGHGDHVYLAETKTRAEALVHTHPPGFFALQTYLPTDHDLRILVVGYRAVGAMRRNIKPGEYRANIAKGAIGSPADLTPELAALAERASRILERPFAGVDVLVHDGQAYVLEVNQHPGFAGFEKATGLDVADTLITFIAAQVKKEPSP